MGIKKNKIVSIAFLTFALLFYSACSEQKSLSHSSSSHVKESLPPATGAIERAENLSVEHSGHSHDHGHFHGLNEKHIGDSSDQRVEPAFSNKLNTENVQTSKINQKAGVSLVSTEPVCDDNGFMSSGSTLVNEIKKQGFQCVERLFGLAAESVRAASFTNANILTVAEEARKQSVSYNGTDSNMYLRSLFYWIRAAYFFGNRKMLTPENQNATRKAIEALTLNSHFLDKTAENAGVVAHAGANLNNALIGEHFVAATLKMLNQFDESYEKTKDWGDALAGFVWNSFNSCANVSECRTAHHKPGMVSTLSNFMFDNISWLKKPAHDYHLHNLGYQLANLYTGKSEAHFASIQSDLKGALSKIFAQFGPYKEDDGRRGYLQALTRVNDLGVCADYGLCDKKEEILAKVLDDRISCPSGTLYMWAQDMNQEQLEWACESLKSYETHFHEKLQTGRQPVTPDDNEQLRMIVFNDRAEWQVYGGFLFGAGTDNGGLYLEGDPSKPGDIATFFAYEDVPQRPIFDIWNLRHEYIHYLDGRFNKKGSFGEVYATGRTTWYTEGVAEYISRKDCNDDAAAEAKRGTYALSTIFQNSYGSSTQTQIYPWGYLANRFMFEKHNQTYRNMIMLFREGQYQTYRDQYVDKWVDQKVYDNEFKSWLSTVESKGCVIDTTRPDSPVEPISIEDIQGGDLPGVNACAMANKEKNKIVAGEATCLEDLSGNNEAQMAIYVPTGLVNVTMEVTLRHGNGDTVLLHRFDSRPNKSIYDYRSDSSGADQTIEVKQVKQGWNYIHVLAQPEFSNVTLLVRYIQEGEGGRDPSSIPEESMEEPEKEPTPAPAPKPMPNPIPTPEEEPKMEPIDDKTVQGSDAPGVNACQSSGGISVGSLSAGEAVCIEDRERDQAQLAFYVPAKLAGQMLEVTLRNGSGGTLLLHRYKSRPNMNGTDADYKSNLSGADQTLIVNQAQAGWNYIHVVAKPGFTNVTLLVRYVKKSSSGGEMQEPSPLPTEDMVDACSQSLYDEDNLISAGQSVCLKDRTRDQAQLALYVPADRAGETLVIRLAYGNGNTRLLHRYDSRPNSTIYDHVSDQPGADQMIEVKQVQSGWNYIHIEAQNSGFSNVTLSTELKQ